MRLDANEVALNRHLQSLEAQDAQEEIEKEAFENLAADNHLLYEAFAELDKTAIDAVGEAVMNEHANATVDYTEVGRLVVQGMAKYIGQETLIDSEVQRIIDWRYDQ